ncbi:MAG: DUF1580 domain-containing protein [Planctomycetes bacterium]|nr:DUF1580 domain-containing protein [Planctomycetota bacterium]
MAISLDEHLVTLNEARARLPGRPDISTLWRWRQRGVRGVKLETLVVGGRRYTTVEALERFVAATTAAAGDKSTAASALSRQREREIAAAETACERAGI